MARKKITDASTITPVDSDATVFISQEVSGVPSLRRASLSDLISKMLHTHTQSQIVGLVAALAGKASTAHTHTKSQITDMPTTLPNPNAITIGGTAYDGSAAVSIAMPSLQIISPGTTTYDDISKSKATFVKMRKTRPAAGAIVWSSDPGQDDDIAPAYFFYEGSEEIIVPGSVITSYTRYHRKYYCFLPTAASSNTNGSSIFVIYDFYKDIQNSLPYNGDDQKNFTYTEVPISQLKTSTGYTVTAPQKSGTIALTSDLPSEETWTFTLSDGTTITKNVKVGT